ncbi:MAG: SCP2 sterol-binding domain-containing protein [Thermoplasmata archaeon]|nr:SCP2 sterol-binding domain-containing protein [Thermoplasmata archaeon]MCI4355732.1 SCP2 sterol-binding domain-containing protein [Thermoplasmata archaeon]
MARFPSAEWAKLLQIAVNANAEYAEAAKAWEGDVLLRVIPAEPSALAQGIHLDLAHGRCRSATFVPDTRETASEFVFEAPNSVWALLFRQELDPVRAILSHEVRLRGNLAKAMRFTRASGLLVATAGTVPTEF